ncbi:MAG: helix-turn-helix domain-containing protein [Eggerthellaceae bacterium]|nr:helix-turn-helix domain-containing protein [Eggerthellaceae bacterium]
MRIADVTLAEIVDAGYCWEDFEPRKDAIEALAEARGQSADSDFDIDSVLKVAYLSEKEEDEIIDVESINRCDFHSMELTSYARLAYGKGSCSWNERALGAIDYDRSFDDIRILVEDMGDICAVYIKDYGFGYIKPFGECLYALEDFEEYADEEAGNVLRLSLKLEDDIRSGVIDLEKELYDYYHELPETAIKILGDSLNDLVTVQEAADALGVSAARVKRMLADGVLDGFKCGGRLKISKAAVEDRIRYIAEHGKPTRGKARK